MVAGGPTSKRRRQAVTAEWLKKAHSSGTLFIVFFYFCIL